MKTTKSIGHPLIALLFTSALVFDAHTALAEPRTVLHSGSVFTGNPAMPFAQAIAIEGDHVVAVGTNDQLLAHLRPGSTRIDLGGRLVVPGFNDAHVHVLVSDGTYLNTLDFAPGPGPTLAEIQRMLADGAAATPAGTWLYAFVGTNIFEDPQATRRVFDRVTPSHPITLFAWHGHGMWLNSRALTELGFAETEPDPAGGFFRRFPSSNVITGEAHEYAEHQIRRRMMTPVPDGRIIAQYQAFAAEAVKLGYTSLQDMGGLPHRRALSVLEAARLPVRVRAICVPVAQNDPCQFSERGLVRASGEKWFADGTPVERLAFVGQPYADRPDEVGMPNLLPDALLARFRARARGPAVANQMLFHGVGDAAISELLDAMEATGGRATWHDRRIRIEHGDLLLDGDWKRARDLGVVVVQNPTHFALIDLLHQRLVPDVVAQIAPLKSLASFGIPIAIGTDGIGRPQNPFLDLFLATVHPVRPSEAIPLDQALSAFTRGAAYAEFEERRKGMLVPGQLADLAVLSQDIFHIPPADMLNTTSELTMVGGKVVWAAGTLTTTKPRSAATITRSTPAHSP